MNGLDIVLYIPNPKTQNDDTLAFEKVQSPIVISLLKLYYHKKSKGKFRSFIEVETFTVHGSSPKDRKPNERSLVITSKSWRSGSKRKRPPGFDDMQFVEKFLEEVWNNFKNCRTSQVEDQLSSTEEHESHVKIMKTNLVDACDNFLSNFNLENDQKIESSDDFDKDKLEQMMTQIMRIGEGENRY
ncbi:hypothetical protein U1Q18_013369 [Sarracenia purpurea var. burkii]